MPTKYSSQAGSETGGLKGEDDVLVESEPLNDPSDIEIKFELESRSDKAPVSIASVVRQFVESLTPVSPQEEVIRKQRFFEQLLGIFSGKNIPIMTDAGEKIARLFRVDYTNPNEPKVIAIIPDAYSKIGTIEGELIGMPAYYIMDTQPQFLAHFLGQFNLEDPIILNNPEDQSKTVRGFLIEISMGDSPMLRLLINGQEKIIPGIEFVKLQPAAIGS